MPRSKPLKWILRTLLGLLGLLVVLILVVALVRIPIDLTDYKVTIQRLMGRALGREVVIDSKLMVTTSLRPVFEMKGFRIRNPAGYEGTDFARMEHLRFQVRLLPLLTGRLYLDEFRVAGLALFLEENREGAVNWAFADPEARPSDAEPESAAPLKKPQTSVHSDSLVVHNIHLQDLSVSYRKPDQSDPLRLEIDRCTGAALKGQPLRLELWGKWAGELFTASVESASLEELLEDRRTWTELEIKLAQARIKLRGHINLAEATRSLELKLDIEGRQLNRFNQLLGLDLPPVPHYGLTSSFRLAPQRFSLTDLELFVGQSRLHGRMDAAEIHKRSKIRVELDSPQVQIDDFVYDNWSPRPEASDDQQTTETRKPVEHVASPNGPPLADLLAAETLRKLDLDLRVQAEKVLSGEDFLGAGDLTFKLEAGRLSIDPLNLNLPGGDLLFKLSIKPGPQKSPAWMQAEVKNFDLGVMVRRKDPRSDQGGDFNLDLALEAQASRLGEILSNGNGHFDFSVYPQNIRAGVLDLWAIGLLTAVVERSDRKQSQIQCLVGRWAMADGRMKAQALAVDTSRMRICGSGWVDFKAQEVYLNAVPIPKKPTFVSLATPIEVKGRFSDFRLKLAAGGVLGSVIKTVTSPVHVPLAALAKAKLPKDGHDICGMPLGAENRPTEAPAGCRLLVP